MTMFLNVCDYCIPFSSLYCQCYQCKAHVETGVKAYSDFKRHKTSVVVLPLGSDISGVWGCLAGELLLMSPNDYRYDVAMEIIKDKKKAQQRCHGPQRRALLIYEKFADCHMQYGTPGGFVRRWKNTQWQLQYVVAANDKKDHFA